MSDLNLFSVVSSEELTDLVKKADAESNRLEELFQLLKALPSSRMNPLHDLNPLSRDDIPRYMSSKMLGLLVLTCLLGLANSQGAGLPSQAELTEVMVASFNNVDSDGNGKIERFEFDTVVIIGDSDDDGCMTKAEYINFSAGTPAIAKAIYDHFDVNGTDCITVDKVADEFEAMDLDGNGEVILSEFETYYFKLLKLLFPGTK